MSDVFESADRSRLMSRIRDKDTKPELVVRSLLHRMGFRFRLHQPDLPGKPDIVLRKYKSVILVHGCFWHQHSNCKRSKKPSSNLEFWDKKLSRNVERDIRVKAELNHYGWNVLILWECETRHEQLLKAKLESFFVNRRNESRKQLAMGES